MAEATRKRKLIGDIAPEDDTLESIMSETAMYATQQGRNVTIAEIIQLKQRGGWKELKTQLSRITPRGIPGAPRYPGVKFQDINNRQAIIQRLTDTGIPVIPDADRIRLPLCSLPQGAPIPEYSDAMARVFDELDVPGAPTDTSRVFPYGYPAYDEQTVLPRYHQDLINIQGWPMMFTGLQVLARHYNSTLQVEHLTQAAELLEGLKAVMENHLFGAGTHMGQIGRLGTGVEVKISTMSGGLFDGTIYRTYRNYDRFREAMVAVDPLSPTSEYVFNHDILQLLEFDDYVIKLPSGKQISPIHINRTADAGFPYILATANPIKGESLFSDMTIATQMQIDAETATDHHSVAEFDNKWDWQRLVKVKAKAETYSLAKITTRTRNIYPVNASMNLPLMCLAASFKGSKPVDGGPLGCSLRGFAPFSGGMERVVASIVTETKRDGHAFRFYADNLYAYSSTGEGMEEIRGLSIDASQMEASHDQGVTKNLVRYMIDVLNNADPGDDLTHPHHCTKIPAHNAMLCQWIAEKLCDGWIGVMETIQFHGFGIPSGFRLTFETNHAKSALLVHRLHVEGKLATFLDDRGEISEGAKNTLRNMGYPYKVEVTTDNNLGNGFENLLKHPYTLETRGKECELDMLGFDAVAFSVPEAGINVIIPVLAKTRLLKSMSFRKSRIAKRFGNLTELQQNVMDYMTMAALYLMGGWRQPYCYGFFSTLSQLAGEIQKYTGPSGRVAEEMAISMWRNTVTGLEEVLDEGTSRIIEGRVGTWLSGLIPSLADVLDLCHSTEAGDALRPVLAAQHHQTIYSGGKASGYATLVAKREQETSAAKRARLSRTP